MTYKENKIKELMEKLEKLSYRQLLAFDDLFNDYLNDRIHQFGGTNETK